jgi:hypothetical protein
MVGGLVQCVVYSFVACGLGLRGFGVYGFIENVARALYVAEMSLASRYRYVMQSMLFYAAHLPWLLPVAIWKASCGLHFHSFDACRSVNIHRRRLE